MKGETMFEYKKDKYELMAEAEGENAFAEAIEVAEEFARQINSRYRRTITDWSVYSTFDDLWWDGNGFIEKVGDVYVRNTCHFAKFDKPVSIDVSPYGYSEPVELAWELEAAWNKHLDYWNVTEDRISRLFLIGQDLMAEELDTALDAAHEKALEEMAEIVERWLDSIECWYWSSEYADELRQEDAA